MSSSSPSSSVVAEPPWAEMPREITEAILLKLGAVEILSTAQKVCTTWRHVCQDPAMWQRINIRYADDFFTPLQLEKMCCRAVDLSQGHLTDITIQHFGSDHLLLYITQRSNRLRRLQLVTAHITGDALSEAVKSLPLLEELHIYYNAIIDAKTVENIGRSCPLLTSFKLNGHRMCSPLTALAIASNMPQLCHLQIIDHSITNEGLEAILDGCPRLESLDIRKCTNVCIAGDGLERLCSQRIRDLRLPGDPLDDYVFRGLHDGESYDYYYEVARDELVRTFFDMGCLMVNCEAYLD